MVTVYHIFLQCDGVFQGQSHGVEEPVSGFIPDYHPPGFYPPGDVHTDVLYFVHSNVYRKMRLPLLDRRKLRGRERYRIYFDQSPVKSCFSPRKLHSSLEKCCIVDIVPVRSESNAL